MLEYANKSYDEERALYHIEDALVKDCKFEGERDGESPLKECHHIYVKDSLFNLRYPLWHLKDSVIQNCEFKDNARAPVWYGSEIKLVDLKVGGIKFLRECQNVIVKNSEFINPEFGWYSSEIKIDNCQIDSVYAFLNSKNISINNLKFSGKYSFQYVENMEIRNSFLDTKDAFWHSTNVTVYNTELKGEYLAWYSKNLTLIDCHIIGTQPFCYCDNLKLVNCTMEDTDFAFEYSQVNAEIKGSILSIKNPLCGKIVCSSVGEIIFDEYKRQGQTDIIELDKKSYLR